VDVTGLLLRAGATRPHVMIAAMPGATDVRLTAEEQLRRRRWPDALTPADADVLLVAGTAAPDIAEAVEAAWAAVPAPRVRVHATRPDDIAPALDIARAELASAADQRRSAATRHPGSHGGHDTDSREAMSGAHHGHGMGEWRCRPAWRWPAGRRTGTG